MKTPAEIYKYCAYQDRCRSEVAERLQKLGIEGDEAEEIIRHLKAEKFLNEARFCKSYVRGKFYHKQWGKRKIRFHLRGKGLADELIEQAMEEEIPDEDYEATVRKLTAKKEKELQYEDEWKKRAKIRRYLAQKGF